jgi:hypothetical protein
MKATTNSTESHLNLTKRIHEKFFPIRYTANGIIFESYPQLHNLDGFCISHNAMLDLEYIDYSKLIKK